MSSSSVFPPLTVVSTLYQPKPLPVVVTLAGQTVYSASAPAYGPPYYMGSNGATATAAPFPELDQLLRCQRLLRQFEGTYKPNVFRY